MTEHLPECHLWLEPMLSEQDWCICDRLRACQQRVRQEIDREAFVLDQGDPYREVYRAGYRNGLDAAREAVEGLRGWSPPPQMLITAALDAIDALREEQAPPPLPPSVGVPTKPMWPLREEQK